MHEKILLADDHAMLLIGLRGQIESMGFTNINSVKSCNKLLEELKRNPKNPYTHLILDIGLSDGSSVEILQAIRSLYPNLHIMIYSGKPVATFQKALGRYGISHFLSKEAEEEEALSKLRRFLNSEEIRRKEDQPNPFSKLSPGELQALHYILQGIGTNQIATILNLDQTTVSTYKRRILQKTEMKNVFELLELAKACNIV